MLFYAACYVGSKAKTPMMSLLTPHAVTAAIVLVLLTSGQCTQIHLTASPDHIQTPVTASLVVRCSLDDSPSPAGSTSSPTGGGLVGRAVSSSSQTVRNANSNSSSMKLVGNLKNQDSKGFAHSAILKRSASKGIDVVRHVASITITRDGAPVATVSTFSPAVVESDMDKSNIHISSDTSNTSGELGYLQLSWDFPTDVQVGVYECLVSGITKLGHTASFKQSIHVAKASTEINDLIREIRDLKMDNIVQKAEIASLKADVQHSKHVESGSLQCGNSDSWTKGTGGKTMHHNYGYFTLQRNMTQTFKTDYATPPVVFLSINHLISLDSMPGLHYATKLVHVDQHSFTLTCGNYDNPHYKLQDIEVDWIAVPV